MLSSILPSRFGQGPADLAERVAWLERKARAMRAKALVAHWSYDLALHTAVLTVLAVERAALAADETLLTSPDQQDVLRVAA